MRPLLQSVNTINNIQSEIHGFGLSQATFVNDKSSDIQRINSDLYSKVKSGDIKGVRYLLGINDDDTFNHMQPINVQKMVDQKKNTLLIQAVWIDNTKIFIDLIKYSLNYFSQSQTQQWITQQNDSGHQCMHLATQKGNIAILDAILNLGINLEQKNKYGQTNLHIASQADSPIMLYYLAKIAKLNLDSVDNDQSTALHLASYLGSEQCASLLLAWGCKINLKNNEGCTPLHASAMRGEYKITKNLLLYNAKTRLKNKQGKTALDLANENNFSPISQIIMEYQMGNIRCNNIFGQNNKPRINKKWRLQMYAFIFMLSLNLIYQFLFIIVNNLFGYIQIIQDVIEVLLFVYMVNSDPGYQTQYKQNGQVFYQILKYNTENLEICSECETLKAQRSHHCYFCNRCIIVYDHHCPWINNCIGANNHLIFMVFIWLTFLTIGFQLFLSINMFTDIIWKYSLIEIKEFNYGSLETFNTFFNALTDLRKYLSISKGVEIEYIVMQLLITFIFFALLSYLLCTQMKNMFENRTTYERLKRKAQRLSFQQPGIKFTGNYLLRKQQQQFKLLKELCTIVISQQEILVLQLYIP